MATATAAPVEILALDTRVAATVYNRAKPQTFIVSTHPSPFPVISVYLFVPLLAFFLSVHLTHTNLSLPIRLYVYLTQMPGTSLSPLSCLMYSSACLLVCLSPTHTQTRLSKYTSIRITHLYVPDALL